MVGTFSDDAPWLLQGQKLITGGEGGIVLTKHAAFHHRQVICHYNKTEVQVENTARNMRFQNMYFLTGTGLKNRAHHPPATYLNRLVDCLKKKGLKISANFVADIQGFRYHIVLVPYAYVLLWFSMIWYGSISASWSRKQPPQENAVKWTTPLSVFNYLLKTKAS